MATNIISQPTLLGNIDKITKKASLAARICDIQPMTGPLGVVTGMQRNKDTDKIITKTSEVIPKTENIDTEFTTESLEDMFRIYGEDIHNVLALYLADELMYRIDRTFVDLLKSNAVKMGELTFNSSDFKGALLAVGQSIVMSVLQGLSDLPISDNRSQNAFCIVSPDVGAIIAVSTIMLDNDQSSADDDSPSYLGRALNIDFYIDYTHDGSTTDNIIFGTKGNGISRGSAILCPYIREWRQSIDPATGELKYFLIDRTGVTINPIDQIYIDADGKSGYLGKFDVDVSDLKSNVGYTGR